MFKLLFPSQTSYFTSKFQASYTLLLVPTSILSFLIVFIIDMAFYRYHQQYLSCQSFSAILLRLALVFRTHFGDDSVPGMRETRHSLLKLLVATHALAFGSLPQSRKAFIHLWVLEYLKEKNLLTESQVFLAFDNFFTLLSIHSNAPPAGDDKATDENVRWKVCHGRSSTLGFQRDVEASESFSKFRTKGKTCNKCSYL